jgi:AcrR family transcriptional regulator
MSTHPTQPEHGDLLPPRANVDGTRRRVWEAALTCFGERGYHGVSVREIARAAGVQAGSIYAHVASKEQLLAELMVLGHEEHNHLLRQALLETDADPVHQISALVRAHVRLHAAYPLLARVCNREMEALSPANRERVLLVRHDSEQIFQQVIERGARLGVFEAERPWLVVAAIGAMGIRVAEWWEPARGFTVEEVEDEYAEFAVRIVTGTSGRGRPSI